LSALEEADPETDPSFFRCCGQPPQPPIERKTRMIKHCITACFTAACLSLGASPVLAADPPSANPAASSVGKPMAKKRAAKKARSAKSPTFEQRVDKVDQGAEKVQGKAVAGTKRGLKAGTGAVERAGNAVGRAGDKASRKMGLEPQKAELPKTP
jgi:hypothetical protein